MPSPRATGHAYRLARAAVLAASDVCWLCGHPGAQQVDHIIPRKHGGPVADPDNMRPAHGGSKRGYDNPCPTCGQRCNQRRGAGRVPADPVRSQDW